jgi:heat shock protein HtpX
MIVAQFGVPVGLAMAASVMFGFGPLVGLALAGATYGAALFRVVRIENDRDFDRAHAHAPTIPAIQDMAAMLAGRLGLATPAVRLIDDRDSHGLNMIGDVAATTGAAIYVSSRFKRMPCAEREFVLAHEMAHMRAADLRMQVPIRAAIHGSLFLTGVAGVAMATAVIATGGSVVAAFYGATWFGFFYAHHVVQKALAAKIVREQEYRADENALRLTRDFNAAVSLIDRLDDTGPGGIYEEDAPQPSMFTVMEKLFGTHPVRDDRVKALRAVWKDMVAADPSLQKPRAVPLASAPTPRP